MRGVLPLHSSVETMRTRRKLRRLVAALGLMVLAGVPAQAELDLPTPMDHYESFETVAEARALGNKRKTLKAVDL